MKSACDYKIKTGQHFFTIFDFGKYKYYQNHMQLLKGKLVTRTYTDT